ncbi:hypothetical protein PR202_ga27560 [Eleusine coracana subsp. coracana]|uniref:Uncharacterized protein n=1 Tax=Eleusine coracana subsp. coracana TaxID=191504 RepID=A0AAV5DGE4_ELECO|nr:hypothetical protein PR202_ga27560 [Eleusine coracana subsp. coracana]
MDHLKKLSSLKSLRIWNLNDALCLGRSASGTRFEIPVNFISIDECSINGKELSRLLIHFPKLSSLHINDCRKITALSVLEPQTTTTSVNKEENAQMLCPQQQLDAEGEDEITAEEGMLLLPPQLEELDIESCPELILHHNNKGATVPAGGLQDHITGALTVPMCSFFRSSLTTIVFHWNDELERFSMEQEEALQLLTSLKHLKLHGCSKLQCLPASLERLPNLKKLEIIYCETIQSLPMEGFPSSLQVLDIILCRGISSLPKAGLPSSLQELYIEHCPAIRSLPKVERRLSSLLKLDVYENGNEELRRQCRKFC